MPPKRGPVSPSKRHHPITRPSRISKTNARESIRNAVLSHARSTTPIIDSIHLQSNVSSPTPDELPPGPTGLPLDLGRILEDGFNRIGLEIRRANDATFTQLVEHMDSMARTPSVSHTNGIPPILSVSTGSNAAAAAIPTVVQSAPLNYLARWPWVDAALINSIALGEFDIYSLPKLHPDEDYRNRQIAKVAEGIRVPLNGGQPEVMIGRTKMHIAFKEPYTFFSAWQIYISIRSTYDSTRAPGLAFWTEKLFFWLGLTYPWPYILNYIIMYHQKYRKSQPDQWFDYDVQMFSNCVTIPTQKPSTSTLAVSTFTQSQSKPAKRSLALPISEQICRNYNYFTCPRDPCPRRHVCALCERKDHLAPQCPSSKHSPGAK